MHGTIALGSDHAGYTLKEALKTYLTQQNIQVEDFGPQHSEKCDYPDLAAKVAESIQCGKNTFGVLCCGSGIGMAIAANRFAGVRAAVCHDWNSATMSRRHNNTNVICFGERVIALPYAQELLSAFLKTEFEGGHHTERVQKMDDIVRNGDPVAC